MHLMAGNVAEGIILVLGICVGLDPPLNPLQILWINLVTGISLSLSCLFVLIYMLQCLTRLCVPPPQARPRPWYSVCSRRRGI